MKFIRTFGVSMKTRNEYIKSSIIFFSITKNSYIKTNNINVYKY